MVGRAIIGCIVFFVLFILVLWSLVAIECIEKKIFMKCIT